MVSSVLLMESGPVSAHLEHSQKQVLFSTFVLIAVYREHYGLQQLIDLCHCDKSTKMCYMSRFALKQEKQVAVLLRLLIV